MTTPTIGRVVYYRPSGLELQTQQIEQLNSSQPFRADVCFVNSDGSVNLSVNDHFGNPHVRRNVPFFETEQFNGLGAHAHWMPYQIAAAAAAAQTPDAVAAAQARLAADQAALAAAQAAAGQPAQPAA